MLFLLSGNSYLQEGNLELQLDPSLRTQVGLQGDGDLGGAEAGRVGDGRVEEREFQPPELLVSILVLPLAFCLHCGRWGS